MDAVSERQFGEWVAARLPGLLRLGHLLTGDPGDAEDLVQSALVRTYRAWPRVQEPDAFVRRVLVNARNSWWARRRPVEQLLVDVAVREDADRIEQRDTMWRALATLPRRQRAVLVLRYYEDLSEAEIADVLGCSQGTVKSQASKALAKLRRQVVPDSHDQESETTSWTA